MANFDFRITRTSRVKETKEKIARALDEMGRRVFSPQDLIELFRQHRDEWWLLSNVSADRFITYLVEELGLRRIVLEGGSHTQKFIRYLWREASPVEVASTLRSNAYLCHASAVFVHGLTDQLPRVLFANYEQSPKPKPGGTLTQESINRAFRGKQRESTFAFNYEDYKIILLSGKNTKNLEVRTLPLAEGGVVRVTSLERTLIDIAVRPVYAGGVYQVQEAFTKSKGTASVAKLVTTLRKLDYAYPYHQAIGFYMERAGYPEDLLKRLAEFDTKFDFYLVHGMKEFDYHPHWRLFHPKGM